MTSQIFSLLDQPEQALEAAHNAILAGELVVFPTDTVYGVGAAGFNAQAVNRLLAAKGRGRNMPPPVLISDADTAHQLAVDIPKAALDLMQAFWPGPLTLVFTMKPNLAMDLGDLGNTIALRVPNFALTRELLRRTGPLAVSSANLSGHPSATVVDMAQKQLANSVSVYLAGGATPGEEPSSIVDFSHAHSGKLVRLGVLSLEQIRQVAPQVED